MSEPQVAITLNLPDDLARLTFPSRLDRRLQLLLDKNQEEGLSADELEEAEELVALSELLSSLKARAELARRQGRDAA
jgi:hypothetical protein